MIWVEHHESPLRLRGKRMGAVIGTEMHEPTSLWKDNEPTL